LPRVFRVGEIEGIVERTLARMHDAAGRVSALRSCGRCGAPMFLTKRHTYACAALCFKAVAPPAPVAPVAPVPVAPVAVPMVKAAPVVRVETTPPTPTPKPFRDPFATRTLADVLRGQASVAVPVKPAPCVDGWEHYGAKEEP